MKRWRLSTKEDKHIVTKCFSVFFPLYILMFHQLELKFTELYTLTFKTSYTVHQYWCARLCDDVIHAEDSAFSSWESVMRQLRLFTKLCDARIMLSLMKSISANLRYLKFHLSESNSENRARERETTSLLWLNSSKPDADDARCNIRKVDLKARHGNLRNPRKHPVKHKLKIVFQTRSLKSTSSAAAAANVKANAKTHSTSSFN